MSKPFKLFATYAKIIPVLSHIICLLCFIIMNIDVLIIHKLFDFYDLINFIKSMKLGAFKTIKTK